MKPKKSLKELRIEATELKLPGRSKYKKKADLEKALDDFKNKPIPKGTQIPKQIPIPPPRKNRKIMNAPVPEINVPTLEPMQRPLRPPRAKEKLSKSAENTTNWFDWLRNSGRNLVDKTSEKWKRLKKSVTRFFDEDFKIRKNKVL